MDRVFVGLAGLLGFLAVALGAFGAHGLKGRIPAELLDVFEVGVRYHLAHAVALLAVAALRTPDSPALWQVAGWLFVAGIAIFSGSLYILALSGVRWLGAVTPIGGLCFLAGWACLVFGALTAGTR